MAVQGRILSRAAVRTGTVGMGGVCSGSRAWTKVRGCVLGQIVSDVPEMGQGSAQA